jgi:hypothetical protein
MDTSRLTLGAKKSRLGWIAILAIALLTTSLQAKLGLYHPQQSQEHLVSQVFKVSECRLERAVANPPMVVVNIAASVVAIDDNQASEPEFLDYAPPRSEPRFHSRSHWFRPPPVRS